MWSPGIGELSIILVIILVCFGAGKLPKVARDVGEGMRGLREGLMDEPKVDEKEKDDAGK